MSPSMKREIKLLGGTNLERFGQGASQTCWESQSLMVHKYPNTPRRYHVTSDGR